jgi:hypothetical protein
MELYHQTQKEKLTTLFLPAPLADDRLPQPWMMPPAHGSIGSEKDVACRRFRHSTPVAPITIEGQK